MKKSTLKILIAALFATILSSFAIAQETSVKLTFKLSPVGSFEAKTSMVQGKAIAQGAKVTASGIIVPLKTLTTGMQLRDTHMKDKYLEVSKFPDAELVMGEGENGKGKGTLKIRGVTKPIEGTYKVSGKTVSAEFKFKLSDYNITGVKHLGVGVKDEATAAVVIPLESK